MSNKQLQLRIVEFKPGRFYAEYRGWLRWKSCYVDWLDEDEPIWYSSKFEAEQALRTFKKAWEEEQKWKAHIPQEWRYPPNKLDKT